MRHHCWDLSTQMHRSDWSCCQWPTDAALAGLSSWYPYWATSKWKAALSHVTKAHPPPSIYILWRLHVPSSHSFDWYHPFPSVTSHRISTMLLNLTHLTSGPDRSLLWGFLSTTGRAAAILASTSNANKASPISQSWKPSPDTAKSSLDTVPKCPDWKSLC